MRQFSPILDGETLPSISVDRTVSVPVLPPTLPPSAPITVGNVALVGNGAIGSPPSATAPSPPAIATPNNASLAWSEDPLSRPSATSINGAPFPDGALSFTIFGPRSTDVPMPPDPHSGDGSTGVAMNQAPAYGATTSAPGVNGNVITAPLPVNLKPILTPTDQGGGWGPGVGETVSTTSAAAATSTTPAPSSTPTGGGALAGTGSVIDGLTSMLGGYTGLNNPLNGVQTATQGALQGVTPTAVPTASSSNPALIVIVLAALGLGVFWYMHAHKKKGALPHGK